MSWAEALGSGLAPSMEDVWEWMVVRTDEYGLRIQEAPQLQLDSLDPLWGGRGLGQEEHSGLSEERQEAVQQGSTMGGGGKAEGLDG